MNKTRFLTRSVAIAVLYVMLTYLSSVFGLSSGVIQFRLSEALCILPVFTPCAIPGLFAGCVLANLLTGAMLWDIVFGSLATLLASVVCYFIGKSKGKILLSAPIPNIIINSIAVPIILSTVYGAEGSIWFFFITVFIGEFVCSGIVGLLLMKVLQKNKKLFQ